MKIDTLLFTHQRKNLERKQFVERMISIVFMLLLLVGIIITGLEFTTNKIESNSWIKVVAGLGVCWFSIYGMKIILKIK